LTAEQIEEIRLEEPAYIYMTIDDLPGYNKGADYTLDAFLVRR